MSQKTLVFDETYDHCYGCGQRNELGLRLRFRELEEGGVETDWVAAEHFCGAPGIVHGGVQATLLDEVMGAAIHAFSGEAELDIVTAEFKLRYRRPARAGAPLKARARCVRSRGRDYFAEGEIVDEAGEVLTRAEAHWRRLA